LLDRLSKEKAQKAFDTCVRSLEQTMKYLETPMPQYLPVSIRQGYEDSVSSLVVVTRDLVRRHLGDAWLMWAMAQRASVPVKIEACVDKGLSYYWRALASNGVPGVGQGLLRDCLAKVHQDIVACWNFREGETILNSEEFKQLMFYLTQDVSNPAPANETSPPPELDRIAHFVTLVTAASAPIAPPVAILGLTYFFLHWVSNAILDTVPDVQRLLMAYAVDLILVMESLFKFTLQPGLSGTTSWGVLKEAFEAYERSDAPQDIHDAVRTFVDQSCERLELVGISQKIEQLIHEHHQLGV